MTENYKTSELDMLFNDTLTENGDKAYKSTGNKLIDVMFMAEYYSKHLDEVKCKIGTTPYEKLFSMFIRDPRFGLGYKDLGRKLMAISGCNLKQVVKAGSFKDLRECKDFYDGMFDAYQKFLREEIENGNELAKKWAPRYSSKSLMLARRLAKAWGMTKQEYGHFVKCNTTENKLSRKDTDSIIFEHVPSNALMKYWQRFLNGEDTSERFNKYLESVKKGDSKMNLATTTVYDIYRNRHKIDANICFDKIEKVSGSWLPIVDTSGSMTMGNNDAMGKALSIGHYLGKCSTYCPDSIMTFSSEPHLIHLGQEHKYVEYYTRFYQEYSSDATKGQYYKEIASMYTGDCTDTNLSAVMNILGNLKNEFPEYLIILSDMQFNAGGGQTKDQLMADWKHKGIKTKIVWWNFDAKNTSTPELDSFGNIFLSGYNPMLLKYLESGFDAKMFLDKLLVEYMKNITK